MYSYQEKIEATLKELKINFSKNQVLGVNSYLDLLYENNMKVNLVGTKDKESILIRHIFDSLSILYYSDKLFDLNVKRIIDIGTGAGLPGFILSLFLKEKDFYLLDKTQKKISFLNTVSKQINADNVNMVKGRAEEISRNTKFRESFDVVLARAVTKINILIELTIPFCRINGRIVFYKSIRIFEELDESRTLINKLGGEVEDILEVRVPFLEEYRNFLIIRKTNETPAAYPRKFAKILRGKI